PPLCGEERVPAAVAGVVPRLRLPQRYLQATWDILEGRVETRVRPTGPGMSVDPSAEVAESAAIAPRVVLGAGCVIGSGAEIRESVLLDGCRVGMGASLSGSVLSA